MDFEKIEKYLNENGEPRYRLDQIKEGFFKNFLDDYDQLTNLPLELRNNLKSVSPWFSLKILKKQENNESVKFLFSLSDGNLIESVLIRYQKWNTICLSVMSGCPLACKFCATGQSGFKRNLFVYEIVDQIVILNNYLKDKNEKISRVVFMGMGEPFLNWENVWQSIKVINDKDGFNIGQRHITVSTAGIVKKIYDFSDLDTEINLAISLHSPFQEKREEVMPIAKENPLTEILQACLFYVNKTKRKLFFEYALIKGFNDSEKDVVEIKKILNHSLFHLNIIKLNKTDCGLLPPEKKTIDNFLKQLDNFKIPYTLRRSVGEEINAACGQLAGLV